VLLPPRLGVTRLGRFAEPSPRFIGEEASWRSVALVSAPQRSAQKTGYISIVILTSQMVLSLVNPCSLLSLKPSALLLSPTPPKPYCPIRSLPSDVVTPGIAPSSRQPSKFSICHNRLECLTTPSRPSLHSAVCILPNRLCDSPVHWHFYRIKPKVSYKHSGDILSSLVWIRLLLIIMPPAPHSLLISRAEGSSKTFTIIFAIVAFVAIRSMFCCSLLL